MRVTRPSVISTGLPSARPVRDFPAASANITTAVAAVHAIPTGLGCAANRVTNTIRLRAGGEVQSNWKSHIDKVRADAVAAKADMNADVLERRAENAEADADAAIAFAYAAVDEAEYQVLNAALARMDAETAATRSTV